MPQTAEVNLAYDMGTSELPVVWDLSSVNLNQADTYEVTGVVQSISANTDAWVGDGGSTLHTAANKELYSSDRTGRRCCGSYYRVRTGKA